MSKFGCLYDLSGQIRSRAAIGATAAKAHLILANWLSRMLRATAKVRLEDAALQRRDP